MASAWGGSWGSAWGNSWGSTAAAVVPTNPHAGGQAGGGRGSGRGSPGGGGDNEWYKRLRAEIDALLADPDPDRDDIEGIGREIEAQDGLPDAVLDAAHEMAVSKTLSEAENAADLLEKLTLLSRWLQEQDELARIAALELAIEIEAEEFLLLVS